MIIRKVGVSVLELYIALPWQLNMSQFCTLIVSNRIAGVISKVCPLASRVKLHYGDRILFCKSMVL